MLIATTCAMAMFWKQHSTHTAERSGLLTHEHPSAATRAKAVAMWAKVRAKEFEARKRRLYNSFQHHHQAVEIESNALVQEDNEAKSNVKFGSVLSNHASIIVIVFLLLSASLFWVIEHYLPGGQGDGK